MRCGQCEFENPDGFAFCGRCGQSLAAACARCGTPSPPGFAFCGKCGAPLGAAADRLTPADLNRLQRFLPVAQVEALRFDPVAPPPQLLRDCLRHLTHLLEISRSHLPAPLVAEVERDPRPGQIGGEFIEGTLLFADISGFTAMSERLSRIGREGAEEITAIVNRYFGVMLSILREHQGQLVKFGGDALLGLFVGAPGESTALAAETALSMQAAMSEFAETRTSQGVVPLHMKVGLHRGRFFAARVGSLHRMEYALFGADVNATARAEAGAQAGEIVLDEATLRAIPGQHRAAPRGAGLWALEQLDPGLRRPAAAAASPPDPLTPAGLASLAGLRDTVQLLEALTPFLPAGLLARLAHSTRGLSLEGEHRLVAVLFANVEGLGELADQLGPGQEARIVAQLQRYFVAMNDSLADFGGVVNKMDLADHGDKLLAFFGAPVAHEDDAERAVRAAWRMQQALSPLSGRDPEAGPAVDLRQKIGLSYGYVFAGYLGSDWRREYTVMGDEVNLAARLMAAAAPGSITVSGHVRRKAQGLFQLEPRGEVRLKGKQHPFQIFAVTGPRAVPEPVASLQAFQSGLVGRQAEWQQLLAALSRVLTGRGQVISLVGEAGLGKSRLAAELRQHAASQPLLWIEGRCLSYTESASYYPFKQIVGALLGLELDEPEPVALARVRDTLDGCLPADAIDSVRPYLLHFTGLPLEEMEEAKVRYLDDEALQRRTFIAISRLIEGRAQAGGQARPVVLVLEDIHWMDQASLALLDFLLPLVDRAPVMLILLYRPEREKGCWRIHERAARDFTHCATAMTLHPLPADDTRQLLRNLLEWDAAHPPDWLEHLQQRLLDRTEGNPLYLEEVLRMLIDKGALTRNGGGRASWHLSGSLDSLQMPDTLQGVLMARLDRLDEPPRQTAQVASVVGRIFPLDVLLNVLSAPEAELTPQVVRLQQHAIIRESRRTPVLEYTFWHGLLQEVCYASLLARTRRQYHTAIAAHLESSLGHAEGASGADSESSYPLIAHHAFAGRDWTRALRFQLLAGQRAQRLFANREAIEHFTKALECAQQLDPQQTLPERQAIHAALGELLTVTGQYDRAQADLTQAHTLAAVLNSPEAEAHACRRLARLHELRGEYPAAFEWIERGLAALGERHTAEAAQLRLIAGLIHSRQGQPDRAQQEGQQALGLAEELNELAVLARANSLLGLIHLRRNSPEAIGYFRRALDLYQQAGDLQGQGTAHNLIANVCFNTGQWPVADEHYRRAREIFDQLGDSYHRAFADNNLGGLALNQGRLDDALADYQAALQSLTRIGGSPYALGTIRMNLGATFIQRRELDLAHQHLQASQQDFEKTQTRDFLPEMHRHLAEAALAAGDLAAAEGHAAEALGLARELKMRGEEGNSLRVQGEICARQSRPAEAERALAESVLILEALASEYELARSRLALAQVVAARGRPAEAIELLGRCQAVFEKLGAALDLAQVGALQLSLAESK